VRALRRRGMIPPAFRSLVAATVLLGSGLLGSGLLGSGPLGSGLLGLGSAAAETPRIATAAPSLAAATTVMDSPISSAPTQLSACTTRIVGYKGGSTCFAGTGQQRARVICLKRGTTRGYYGRLGPWVGRGRASVASCEATDKPTNVVAITP